MPRVYCGLCQHETSHQHENWHRKQAATLLPSTASNTSSSFLVNSVESNSDSVSSPSSPVASEIARLDFEQDLPSLESPPDELSNINDQIRAWLYGTYPAAEIYDSECDEDRETWMKAREEEDSKKREPADVELDPVLKSYLGQVGFEDVHSESEFWGSDHHLESDSDSEASDPPSGFDWDTFERAATGVAAFDKLGEDFEVGVANLGDSSPHN